MIFDAAEWSFDLSQFDTVWKIVVNLGLLLIFLLIGNTLRRTIPFLRKAFIPSALIGGLLLFLVNLLTEGVFHYPLIDKRIMQIITYHALAIGFIAMSLKIVENNKKSGALKPFQNGALTGATYMLQAVVGLLISLVFFWLGAESFYGAGVILPLGYGQGPGNALTWDVNFSTAPLVDATGFHGEGSFGLTIASIGFIVASIVGVLYINIFKRKGQIVAREEVSVQRRVEEFESNNEIEDSESVDKFSIQVGLVLLAYAVAFGIMVFFAMLTKWTGVGLFNSVAWGFNFIWGVIAATLIKSIVKLLKKKGLMHRKYINNYQMDRISGFAFDLMIIAGVAAIDIKVVKQYALLIAILCVAGAIASFFYVRLMCKRVFKGFEHEAFLVNFGTLTGTASNGVILLREIDPNYETPASNVFVVSQFPAMLFVAPLLLLLNLCGKSVTGTYIALGIFAVLFVGYTLFLLLTSRKPKEVPAEPAGK